MVINVPVVFCFAFFFCNVFSCLQNALLTCEYTGVKDLVFPELFRVEGVNDVTKPES